jgi:hypothetical protein
MRLCGGSSLPRSLARFFDEEAAVDDDDDDQLDDEYTDNVDGGSDIVSDNHVSGDEDFDHGAFDAQRSGGDRDRAKQPRDGSTPKRLRKYAANDDGGGGLNAKAENEVEPNIETEAEVNAKAVAAIKSDRRKRARKLRRIFAPHSADNDAKLDDVPGTPQAARRVRRPRGCFTPSAAPSNVTLIALISPNKPL